MEEHLLSVTGVSKTFTVCTPEKTKTVRALNAVSFAAERGQFLVIGGANGSGKSLLMSIIAGLDEPDEGCVVFNGVKTGLVFQDADSQILGETPREDVAFGPKNLGFSKTEAEQKAILCLEKTGLTEKADSPARLLSGGEKRRLSVAAMLAMDADLFIFDEPYANLDYPGVRQVNEIIAQLKTEGKTLIVLTHELEKILAAADRFLILHKGSLVFDGSPQEGLNLPLEHYGIRNPLRSYLNQKDLLWM